MANLVFDNLVDGSGKLYFDDLNSTAGPVPSLTDVDTDEVILANQTGATYAGANLSGATIALVQGATAVTQGSVTNNDSGGTFNVAGFGTGGLLRYGVATNVRATVGAAVGNLPVTVNPPAGRAFVTFGTLNPFPGFRLEGDPTDIAPGDQLEYDTQGGKVTVLSDGVVSTTDNTVTTFTGRIQDGTGWSADVTLQIVFLSEAIGTPQAQPATVGATTFIGRVTVAAVQAQAATSAGTLNVQSGVDISAAGAVAGLPAATAGLAQLVRVASGAVAAGRATTSAVASLGQIITRILSGAVAASSASVAARIGFDMPWASMVVDQVLPNAGGCPLFRAEQAIRDAAIEFCIRTDVYRAPLQEIDIAAGESAYQLRPDANAEVNHTLAAMRKQENGSYMPLTAITQKRAYYAATGTPQAYTQLDADTIAFAPTPAEPETLYVVFTQKPTVDSLGLPKYLAREYAEPLAWGALARLLSMNGQPWSNPQAAEMYRIKFNREIARVARQVKGSWAGATSSVTARPFV